MNSQEKKKVPGLWSHKSARLYTALTCCLVMTANGLTRNTLNMAMVCMVKSNVQNFTNQNFSNADQCPQAEKIQQEYQGTFSWSSYEQGLLFSALFFGGIITSIPAGWLADRYNPKLLVTMALFLTSVCCTLCPIVALKTDYIGLFVLRFIMGAFNVAFLVTSISSVLARWIPPLERSIVIAIYTAGTQLSLVIGMPLNAVLCKSNFLGGWPAVFYVNGFFGFACLLVWILLASNSSESSKFISDAEKEYIRSTLAHQHLGERKKVTKKIPWMQIVTSPAVLALLVASFSSSMAVAFVQTYTPTYYKEALYLGLSANSLFTALPPLFQMISKIAFGLLAETMKKRTKLSHTWICKIFDSAACLSLATFLIACSFVTCSDYIWAVVLMSLIGLMLSAIVPGYMTSLACIAPAYSGLMTALSRFVGQISAVILSFAVSVLTPQGTVSEWRYVFILIALLMCVQFVVFLFFGSASVQNWAKATETASESVSESSSSCYTESGYSGSIKEFSDSLTTNDDFILSTIYVIDVKL